MRIITLLFVLLSVSAFAQEEYQVEVTYGELLGSTKPLRELVPALPIDAEKAKKVKSNLKKPPNFPGRRKLDFVENPNALPQGIDPLRQTLGSRYNGTTIEIGVNVAGLTDERSPTDPTGDVGRNYYVQAINATELGVYNKDGSLESSFSANTIWTQVNSSSGGDPIVLYDQEINRWLITEFPFGNAFLVAISQSSDPLGAWNAYRFGTPNFPDYPKYGIWPNAYSVSTNEEGGGTHVSYFINRQELIDGETNVQMQRITFPGPQASPGFVVPTPVDWTGLQRPVEDQNPIILSLLDDNWGEARDEILVHTFDLDWDVPSNSSIQTTAIEATPFDTDPCSAPGPGFACMPQPGGDGLDGIPFVVMNQPHYRNFGTHESIVLNFITDVTGGDNLSGIRWVELRRSDGEEWTIYQEGTYSPDDGLDRYMGTMVMDGNGNIGLAYNVSSEEEFAGVRLTGRFATDPLGEMSVNEIVIADGESTLNSNGRFGDYAHMSIDPFDDQTMWCTIEYAGSSGTATRVFNFSFSQDSFDLALRSLVSPQTASNLTIAEDVTVEVSNVGINAIGRFWIGFLLDGALIQVDTFDQTLSPSDLFSHTFSTPVDLSILGNSYEIRSFVGAELDENDGNNVLTSIVRHLPRLDGGWVEDVEINSMNCFVDGELFAELSNFGTETITSADIELYVEGILVSSTPWSGSIPLGQSEEINIAYSGLSTGDSDIELVLANLNGEVDQIATNDTVVSTINVPMDPAPINIALQLDRFPEETSWELRDEAGEIIMTGGPYTVDFELIEFPVCLIEDMCYEFELFDAFGDGLEGNGGVVISDDEGEVLAAQDGVFTMNVVVPFCTAGSGCSLSAEISLTNTSEEGIEDGAILIEVTGSMGSTEFSIDGGDTFQEDNFFGDLPAGDYDIVVMDTMGCSFESTVSIGVCELTAQVNVENESEAGAQDGSIEILALMGTPPYSYSLDNGITFQTANTFTDLPVGMYQYIIRDDRGCETRDSFEVETFTSTQTVSSAVTYEIFPSPAVDQVSVRISNLAHRSSFLPWQMFDSNGKVIRHGELVKYNETYRVDILLHNESSGNYFLKVDHPELDRLLRITKL